MATRRKNSRSGASSSGGITLFGVIVGLVLGLAAAALVAFYITKAPMPFNDKATRAAPAVLLPEVRDAPDPNLGLYPSRSAGAGTPSDGMSPVAPSTQRNDQDVLGELIATLPQAATPPASNAAKPNIAPPAAPSTNTKVAEAKPLVVVPPPAAPKTANASQRYFLQAGAFRSASDAQAIKARILMLGLAAEVHVADVNGTTLNRVRVGPFSGLDAMNQARITLGNEQIATSVVRQP